MLYSTVFLSDVQISLLFTRWCSLLLIGFASKSWFSVYGFGQFVNRALVCDASNENNFVGFLQFNDGSLLRDHVQGRKGKQQT